MKSILILFVLLLGQKAKAELIDVYHKDKEVVVTPKFKILTTLLVGQGISPDHFLNVSFDIDKEASEEMISELKKKYPDYDVKRYMLRSYGELKLSLLGKRDILIHLRANAAGYYYGSAEFIKLKWGEKSKILERIEKGENLFDEVVFDFSVLRKVVTQVDLMKENCLNGAQGSKGYLNVFNRLKKFEKLINSSPKFSKFNKEELMRDFFKECVYAKTSGNISSFVDLDKKRVSEIGLVDTIGHISREMETQKIQQTNVFTREFNEVLDY